MKKLLAAIAVLALSFVACSVAIDSDAAGSDILLYEIKSAGNDEGFSLYNYGTNDIDLYEEKYTLTDSLEGKEGTFSFVSSFVLKAGESVTFVSSDKDADSKFLNHSTYYLYKDERIKVDSKFTFADAGDDIYLLKDGKAVDAFCYGNGTISDKSLWSGNAFKKMDSKKSNDFAVRNDPSTSTAKSWHQWGITANYFDPNLKFDADVTPFLFPNSGGIPIFKELEKASSSVFITMYELTNTNLYALLEQLEKRGVDVTILLEKNPFGYETLKTDAKKMKAVIDAGGEVRFIGGELERYGYVHAKYCIIDNSKVIVTSENWTVKNLNGKVVEEAEQGEGNRGWGAIIESNAYADYMKKIFDNDYDKTYGDVIDFEEFLPNVDAMSLSYSSPTETYITESYKTKITPVMSPDSSWDATLYYIDNSTSRVYSQQQDITQSYADIDTESPIKHMSEKASGGVDARFILNSYVDTAIAEKNVDLINMTSQIKAAAMKNPYVHNKGLICDNMSLISSVNWTENSLTNNREICVAIHSSDISDFFASAFMTDFDKNYDYKGLDITITELKDYYDKPGEITVSVTVLQTGDYTYTWDLDGNKTTTTVPRTVLDVKLGDHKLTVRVTDDTGNEGVATKSFTVGKDDNDYSEFIAEIKPYIIPIVVILLALGITVMKMSSGNKRKRKGGKRR